MRNQAAVSNLEFKKVEKVQFGVLRPKEVVSLFSHLCSKHFQWWRSRMRGSMMTMESLLQGVSTIFGWGQWIRVFFVGLVKAVS